MERVDPPLVADELTMLRSYLDYHRATFRQKTGGLTREQLAAVHPPSTLTLAGLVKHLTLVEDWWFGVTLAGTPDMPPFGDVDFDADPDWEFRTALDDDPTELFARYEQAVAASDANLDTAGSPEVIAVRRTRRGDGISLRHILVHMVEEYARHNGHADLIRESIDGTVGE